MSDAECVVRLARRTLRTCAHGLVLAVLPVVLCLPLFIVSVLSVALLAMNGSRHDRGWDD